MADESSSIQIGGHTFDKLSLVSAMQVAVRNVGKAACEDEEEENEFVAEETGLHREDVLTYEEDGLAGTVNEELMSPLRSGRNEPTTLTSQYFAAILERIVEKNIGLRHDVYFYLLLHLSGDMRTVEAEFAVLGRAEEEEDNTDMSIRKRGRPSKGDRRGRERGSDYLGGDFGTGGGRKEGDKVLRNPDAPILSDLNMYGEDGYLKLTEVARERRSAGYGITKDDGSMLDASLAWSPTCVGITPHLPYSHDVSLQMAVSERVEAFLRARVDKMRMELDTMNPIPTRNEVERYNKGERVGFRMPRICPWDFTWDYQKVFAVFIANTVDQMKACLDDLKIATTVGQVEDYVEAVASLTMYTRVIRHIVDVLKLDREVLTKISDMLAQGSHFNYDILADGKKTESAGVFIPPHTSLLHSTPHFVAWKKILERVGEVIQLVRKSRVYMGGAVKQWRERRREEGQKEEGEEEMEVDMEEERSGGKKGRGRGGGAKRGGRGGSGRKMRKVSGEEEKKEEEEGDDEDSWQELVGSADIDEEKVPENSPLRRRRAAQAQRKADRHARLESRNLQLQNRGVDTPKKSEIEVEEEEAAQLDEDTQTDVFNSGVEVMDQIQEEMLNLVGEVVACCDVIGMEQRDVTNVLKIALESTVPESLPSTLQPVYAVQMCMQYLQISNSGGITTNYPLTHTASSSLFGVLHAVHGMLSHALSQNVMIQQQNAAKGGGQKKSGGKRGREEIEGEGEDESEEGGEGEGEGEGRTDEDYTSLKYRFPFCDDDPERPKHEHKKTFVYVLKRFLFSHSLSDIIGLVVGNVKKRRQEVVKAAERCDAMLKWKGGEGSGEGAEKRASNYFSVYVKEEFDQLYPPQR